MLAEWPLHLRVCSVERKRKCWRQEENKEGWKRAEENVGTKEREREVGRGSGKLGCEAETEEREEKVHTQFIK